MSNDNDDNDMNYYNDWLDKCFVNHFDYSDFTILDNINTGSSAQIQITTLKDIKDAKFVLKCFNYNNITIKEVVNEVISC
jgi:hypothetical protein